MKRTASNKIQHDHGKGLFSRSQTAVLLSDEALFFSSTSSSPGQGARRAWGLACALLLFFFILAAPAHAVPPGTVIDNTAQATFRVWGTDTAATSNPVTLVTEWLRTPAQVELLQYAPTAPGAQMVDVPITGFDPDGTSGGSAQQIASIYPAGSTAAIDLSQPVPLVSAAIYHQGEPIFFRVSDPDQNVDPAVVQTVYALVTSSISSDAELLLLSETGPDTGIFVGYIQSGGLGPVQVFNGTLDVVAGEQLAVQYTDVADAADTAMASALVDPFGRVFDSATGEPVDNVQLALVDAASGSAATVYGDDGISSFPSVIASGGTFVDSSGKVYAFASGEYRFPFVLPGSYRLIATPAAGYAAPSTVSDAVLQALPGAPFAIAVPGSRGEAFDINPGPAVRIDIPVDPTGTGLWLRKTVSREFVAVGDVVQYTIHIENTSGGAAVNTVITDRLPVGLRYRSGSLRRDGQKAADPAISADGRTLRMLVGDLADGATLELRYVAEITAGTKPGKAENRAWAAADTGLTSNTARAAVSVREDLFRSDNFIAGRVIADNCGDTPTDTRDGVAGVRIYLEDGSYVVTDDQGMYHFEGVASGTHVLQMDLESIPDIYEISACGENTRQSGTPFSRFVDLHGGVLWREDFHVRTKTPPTGEARLKMACRLEERTVHYRTDVASQGVPIENARLSVILPEGSSYLTGSSHRDKEPMPDPQQMGNVLIYRLGNAPDDKPAVLDFSILLGDSVQPGRLHTKAMLTFNTPAQKNQRTAMIDTVLALEQRRLRQVQPPIIVRPQFGVLDAELSAADRGMLDRLAERLKPFDIEHVVLTGHTDSRRIRPARRHRFADNQMLSMARARNVARYLAERLNLSPAQMTISGKGARQPIADNTTASGRAINRRVEVKVMSAKIEWVHNLASIKCEDQAVSGTQGVVAVQTGAPTAGDGEEPPAQRLEDIDPDKLSAGLAWVMPKDDYRPHIPSVKLAVQHHPGEKIELLLNDRPVSPLNFDGQLVNTAGSVAISLWRGVDIADGANRFVAVCKDAAGRETGRLVRVIHYAGPPIHAQWVESASRLVANGKDAPVIAVRLTDKDGQPARFGLFGEYGVSPPYEPYLEKARVDTDALTRLQDDASRYKVGPDGIAQIKLAPTTLSGSAVIKIPLADKIHEIRVWLKPEPRDWILVGLAEGTLGYNAVSGNMENLEASDQEEDLYQDGRIAFFAKGRVKGEWLLTAAYDSGRETGDRGNQLFQTIDPDSYYTLYGDATEQRYEASSIRKLYLKIERNQFYALFGDYDTGMTVTELSRYSRKFNGIKTAYDGRRFGFTAFATDTDQSYARDEIRGDGTSGLYRLSRSSIVINSETITIETRDRFRSEIVVSSQALARHVDYNIDYDAGTLFFKAPVYSRDEHFNPTFIVAEYESDDQSEDSYTYGGRGFAKLADGKIEMGATYIHEGPSNAEAQLGGVDARIDMGNGLEVKAEVAASRKDAVGTESSGQAYLAEVRKQTAGLDARAYFREQSEDFGLGQQNGSETATRKIGAEARLQVSDPLEISGELYRNFNLATNAERDLGEARVAYHRPVYDLYSGLRLAEDRFTNGDADRSTQLLLGGSRRFLDNRLQTRLSHEQSLWGNDESADFPTRTTVGADYKLTTAATLFAEHEITQGAQADSQSSRAGVKATPWQGGQVGSSLGREFTENGQRVFANLGLTQTWRINERWSVDGGLDRSQTVQSDPAKPPFNANVPTAAGAEEDFTSISLGAGYTAPQWFWNGRVESRVSDSQDKWGLTTSIAGEVRKGLGLSAGLQVFNTESAAGADALDGDIRLSLALRPANSAWIVLDRLDYIFESQTDAGGSVESRRIVNNLNVNYKPHHRLQMALQYGAKYVLDTFDDASYTGYTDLVGAQVRYDLNRRWDVGLHASVLHSWHAGQVDYRTGVSVGHALAKNMWISAGYNFTGFYDEDFSAADFTAAGPFVKFRLKFDQQSVRELLGRF
jgi:uncharacterized repeat protein (TIGR01451 family)